MAVSTLNLEQCKEYVKNIKDLELSCYQQENLLNQLRSRPMILNREIHVLENTKDEVPMKPSSVVFAVIFTLILDLFLALVGAVIGFIGGLVVRIIAGIFAIVGIFAAPSGWLPFLIGGAVIGYVIALLCLFYWHRDTVSEQRQEKREYPEKLKALEKKQQDRQADIESKKHQLEILPSVVAKSEQELQQTRALLQKYYDLGFIYPKYRGIVPICTIYEYLDSGRCFSLIGHEGAYNLYESELRMNTIIGKLDDVISRLDDISSSQRLLAQEIRQSNTQLQRISSTLDRIENNTALTQYYSSVTASNTSFMSWLAALSYDRQTADR